MPGNFVLDIAREDSDPGDVAINLDAFAVERFSGRRDSEDPRPSFNQLLAESRLEALQRLADRGLAQQKPLCGGRDAMFLDDHHKGAQKIPVELPCKTVSLLARPIPLINFIYALHSRYLFAL